LRDCAARGSRAFWRIHNIGYEKEIRVPEKRPLADFLPTITIKAKDFAAEITSFNTKKNNLRGEQSITGEHIKNNKDVRDLLGKSGISRKRCLRRKILRSCSAGLSLKVKKLPRM